MTRENLLKTILFGVKNDDPQKYQPNKKIFRYVQYLIMRTKWLKYKSILQLTTLFT